MSAEAKLAELQAQRAEVAATRTKEDMRAIGESWLAVALARVSGSSGFVANGHVGHEQVESVVTEFLLGMPRLRDFVIAKLEDRADLTANRKEASLKKLDAAIARAEQEAHAAALAEAHGWRVEHLPGTHLHAVTSPAAVAEALLSLTG